MGAARGPVRKSKPTRSTTTRSILSPGQRQQAVLNEAPDSREDDGLLSRQVHVRDLCTGRGWACQPEKCAMRLVGRCALAETHSAGSIPLDDCGNPSTVIPLPVADELLGNLARNPPRRKRARRFSSIFASRAWTRAGALRRHLVVARTLTRPFGRSGRARPVRQSSDRESDTGGCGPGSA